MSVAIFIPTVNRPDMLERTIVSITETSSVSIYGMTGADNQESIDVFTKYSIPCLLDRPEDDQTFPTRIQKLYESTHSGWILTGSDDIIFRPGWKEAAYYHMKYYSVISFQDLCNPNLPGTNFLIKRYYIDSGQATFDRQKGQVFGPYKHNFCDNELVFVARQNETFYQCDGIIEHFHPAHGRGQWDDTYHWAQSKFHEDGALFHQRAAQWVK